MRKPNFLKNLAAQLTDALPNHVTTLKEDMEKNCQQILTNAFQKFEIITREEFDIQTKVLARTREKVDALQAQVNALEAALRAKRESS